MQKTKTWSILVWSMFLSLIITIVFVWISTKLNKKLNLTSKFLKEQKLDIDNLIKTKIIINKDFTDEYLTEDIKIEFNPPNVYIWTMKFKERTEIPITKATEIRINIVEWWPISFKSPDTLPNFEGLADKNLWIPINIISTWSLQLKNIWWYTKFQIEWDTNFLSPNRKYKIIKKIWNKWVEKYSRIIK